MVERLKKRKILRLLDEYAESHQNSLNQKIHLIAVPLIMFSILGLLSLIPFEWKLRPYFSWAFVVVMMAVIYYAFLSPILAAGMFALSAAMIQISLLFESKWWAWILYVVIFVGAWIAQFIGHHIEGKRPSFMKDLQFLLIGPAWTLSKFLKAIGWRF